MLLAPTAGAPPREVAERLRDGARPRRSATAPSGSRSRAPGFLNLFLSDRWHREATAALLAAGERLGAPRHGGAERVLVEFVSANPTGPVTAASGRGAAYGDSLARLLERAGHDGRARVLRQRRRAPRCELFARVGRGADARRASRPRTATPASTSASWPGSWPPRGATADDLERAGDGRDRGDARADRGDPGALRRPLRHLVVGAPAARVRRGRARARASCARAATSTSTRARSGCGRPSSATTRTGS